MKNSPEIITTNHGKKVIGADGGGLLFVNAVPASSLSTILMAAMGRPPIQTPAVERAVIATEKVDLHFSTAGRRVKKSILGFFKGPDAAKHIWFWAAVSSREEPEFIRDQCHEGLERANPKLYHLMRSEVGRLVKKNGEDREPWQSEIHDLLLERAGVMLVESCQDRTLTEMGELVDYLAKNYRATTNEEKELLRVIGDVATRKWDIPFQKEVREEWIDLRTGRDDDAFRRTRDTIGFKWLPSGPRGPQRI